MLTENLQLTTATATKKPTTLIGGWVIGMILFLNLAQRTRPLSAALTAAAQTHCGNESIGHELFLPERIECDSNWGVFVE
jgi:hypothetical protein